MRYILSTAEEFTNEDFEEIVKELTTTHKEGRAIAMTLAEVWRKEGFEQGIEKGIEKGIERANITTARKLISLGVENEVIIQATGLSVEQIHLLRSNPSEV